MSIDAASLGSLEAWRGRSETAHDLIAAAPAMALSSTLDRDDAPLRAGDTLPTPFHWLYFLSAMPMSQLDVDGHPRRGGFLPPVPLPRRMWAAGRLKFREPLRVGDVVTRESTITDVRMKDGRSGPLVFVTLHHAYKRPGGEAAIVEEQDLVYRDHPRAGSPAVSGVTAPTEAAWTRDLLADPVLLFRYSALTFNAHRIHYDRPYATAVEGYPGLVVHGPLLATLLLDLLRRQWPQARVARFEFRAMRPVFDSAALRLCGDPAGDGRHIHLWVQDAAGAQCMDAQAAVA